jgi:hypothetical protein
MTNYLRVIDKIEQVEQTSRMNFLQVLAGLVPWSVCIDSFYTLYKTPFFTGYDFLNTNRNSLDISIWYNSTYSNDTSFSEIGLLRVPRLVNMVCELNYCSTLLCDFHWYFNYYNKVYYLSYRLPTHTSKFSEEVEWKCCLNLLKICPNLGQN